MLQKGGKGYDGRTLRGFKASGAAE
jgi:hypothetical protein